MAVRVGIVGLGMMGTTHFKSYGQIPDAQVVAVCDVDAKKLAGDWAGAAGNIDTGAAQTVDLAAIRRYSSYGKFMKDAGIDVVDICLPTFLHEKLAAKAFAAGKHVICEKPMALKAAKARKMIDAAAAAGKFLGMAHVLRFWPEYVMLKSMIDSGRYGKVRRAYFSRFASRPTWTWGNWSQDSKRSGAGALDLHIHDTDLVQWYFGKPTAVTSRGTFDPDGGAAHILTAFDVPGGELVVAEGGWDLPAGFPFEMAARILFETAAVDFSSSATPTLTVYDAKTGQSEHPEVLGVSGYTEELRYFIGCIEAGRASDRIMPAEAADAVAIVEAEVRSARSGRTVKIK